VLVDREGQRVAGVIYRLPQSQPATERDVELGLSFADVRAELRLLSP
jgi:hypothetical protein